MYPRGQIDIGWNDLLFALRATLRPEAPGEIERRIEQLWGPDQSVVALSVRSGFDALLQSLDLPPGSEILVSAITIHDMTRIIEAHGLTPVPVDLDMETLSLDLNAMRKAITPNTRALLVAHIFGSRMPLHGAIAVAREHGLLVVEDCAQAYAARDDRGEANADVSMFSFGPIKTNTALGGGILLIRNAALRSNTRAILQGYPRQSTSVFRKRVVKYMGIKALSTPRMFGLFATACKRTGRSHDQVISHALRGFPGPDLLSKIRRQPSASLLALLERRVTTFDNRRIERRTADARSLLSLLRHVAAPGRAAGVHTHWVVPITPIETDEVMARLWNAGFDATRGASSLAVVEPPPGRPECEPANARRVMSHLLYLPVGTSIPASDQRRMAALVEGTPPVPASSLWLLPDRKTPGSSSRTGTH